MSAFKKKIVLYHYTQDAVMEAIRGVAVDAGWRLVSQDRSKTVLREPVTGTALALPGQIEFRLLPLSDSLGVEVSGAQAGFGTGKVQPQVEKFIGLLEKHLDRVGTPHQQQERQQEAERLAAEKREADRQAAQELENERRAAEQRAAELRFQRQLEAEKRKATAPPPEASVAAAVPPAAPVPAAVGAGSLTDDLERLARLHQQGVLTDDEFRQAKQRLLGL